MIKPLITACICTLFTLNARAQLEKKTWLVGGNGSFKSTNETYENPDYSIHRTNVSINPKIGYFLYNNFALGLSPVLEYEKADSQSDYEAIDYGIGPFVRYYFLNNHKAYNLVSEINYHYQIRKFLFDSTKANISDFSLLAGPVIYFNESVGIELLLGYRYRRSDLESMNQIRTEKGFQTSIGLQIHLFK